MGTAAALADYRNLRYTRAMHVISRKALRCFWEQHPDSEVPPSRWFRIVRRSEFASFAPLRATIPSADMVGELVVFSIGGNRYRLVASVHFNRRKLYIRHVLTHAEYDKGAWRS